VSRDGSVKVLDFGLAKLLKEQPDDQSSAPTPASAPSIAARVARPSPRSFTEDETDIVAPDLLMHVGVCGKPRRVDDLPELE
jgi:hypothetical protein